MASKDPDSTPSAENRLKELKNDYQIAITTIKKLEKEKLIKFNQLENSQNLLTEIQGNLLIKNQEIKKAEQALDEALNSKPKKVKDFIKDRDMKELDKKLEECLMDLAKKRAPLIPCKSKTLSLLRDNEKDKEKEDMSIMKIHTVKILYLKGVKDGDVAGKDRSNALELTLRLLSETKFKELKKLACEFWDLEEGMYSLRAYNYALIEYIDENVEQFIKNQKMRPELWLIENNVNAIKCLTDPGDYYTEDNSKNQNKNKDSSKNQIDLEGKKMNYKKFLASFEGAKYIMPSESRIDENHEAFRLESWELNIFTLIITLALLVFTIAIHYALGDFSDRYWITYQMTQSFKNNMADINTTYDDIKSLNDVKKFMAGPLKLIYFEDSIVENPFVNQFVPIGKMKVRFLETKEKDCENEVFGISSPHCFYHEYNSKSWNNIGNGDDKIFKEASDNEIDSTIHGEFSSYDGSGFTWDYYSYEGSEYSKYVSENEDLYTNELRAIIVSFSHYSPTYDYWMFTQVFIEISVYGSIYVHEVQPKVFRSNLYAEPYRFYLVLFFLRSFLSLYFLFYYFYYSLHFDKMNKRNLEYMYSVGGLHDILLVMLTFISLGYAFSVKSDENENLKSKKYIDFTDLSVNYEYAIILNAWSAIPILVRFFNCLTINHSIYLMKLNIDMAIKGMLTYLILIISLFVGFMFVSWTIWGTYSIHHRNMSLTLINNILFSIGIGNTALLVKLNLFWTVLYYILYFNFIIFILICGFIGIYIESYRQIRLKLGYRDEVKVWAFVDYVVWMLGCMNQKRLRQKIEDYIQKRKLREEEKNKKEAEKNTENIEKSKVSEKDVEEYEDDEIDEEEKSEKEDTDRE